MESENYLSYDSLGSSFSIASSHYAAMRRVGISVLKDFIAFLSHHDITVDGSNEFRLLGVDFLITIETQFQEMAENGFLVVYCKRPDQYGRIETLKVDEFRFDRLGNSECDGNTFRIFLGSLMNFTFINRIALV